MIAEFTNPQDNINIRTFRLENGQLAFQARDLDADLPILTLHQGTAGESRIIREFELWLDACESDRETRCALYETGPNAWTPKPL